MASIKPDKPDKVKDRIKPEQSSIDKAGQSDAPSGKKSTLNAAAPCFKWVSPHAEKKAKLERLQNNASHIGVLNSPYFPSTLAEYLEHEAEWATTRAEDLSEKLMKMIGMSATEIATEVNVGHSSGKEDVGTFSYSAKGKETDKDKNLIGDISNRKMCPILGEETTIWKTDYVLRPERRDDSNILNPNIRSAWPDLNELKNEGEHRLATFGLRRFPLPRLDRYCRETVRAKVADGTSTAELCLIKGDDIAWYERDLVTFQGLDCLSVIAYERESDIRMWTENGTIAKPKTPRGPGHAAIRD